ncbi:MAG: HAD family phosphatase [Elusimicrobia bacterium]|nr:HAD family phosphatase [Elusimicrobiota bacterium]
MPDLFKGILFDFDGTLAKTMEGHFNAWQAVMRKYAVDLKPEDYYPLEGAPLQELVHLFSLMKPGAISLSDQLIRQIVQQKENYYTRHSRFTLYPGVEFLVDSLKKKRIRMGIVTAGLNDRIKKSTPQEFLEKFDVLVTGDMTVRGKPYPDPYLKGAEALDLRPDECIVVENAPLGVQSAKAANFYCIGVCSTLDRSYFTEADEMVDCFEDLKDSRAIHRVMRAGILQGR